MNKACKLLLVAIPLAVFILLSGCGKAKIRSISPSKGAVGTTVSIKGNGFGDDAKDARVCLGEMEVQPVLWSNKQIDVRIPTGAETNEITIKREDEKSTGVMFEVLDEGYETILEEQLTPAHQLQTFECEALSISIPPGTIQNSEILAVTEVTNAPEFSEDKYAQTKVYDITIGDRKTFDETLMLEFKLDKEAKKSQYIRAAYWDEERYEWIPAPSHVDPEKGVVRAYTDHLTKWRVLALKQFYSVHETPHFIIAYNKKEKTDLPDQKTIKNMQTMAEELGKALDKAYGTYFALLGQDYSPPYLYLEMEVANASLYPGSWFKNSKETIDTRAIVMLSSSYNKYGASYSWLTEQIKLPAKYTNMDDLQATAAHELFHAFQNHRLTVAEMGMSRWLMEATAEYASYYVGTQIGIQKLHNYTRIDNHLERFENREEGHEYGMASYIKFLADNGADFGKLWKAVASSRPVPESGFNDYVQNTLGTSNNFLYKRFWHDVLTNSSRPEFKTVSIGVRSRMFGLQNVLTFPLTIVRDGSMAAAWTTPRTYNPDGKKTLLVEVDGDIPDGVWVDIYQVDGYDKKTATHNRTPSGKAATGTLGGGVKYIPVEFTKTNNEIIYVTAYGTKAKLSIRVSDVKLTLKPEKVDFIEPAKPCKFEATVENVPKAIEDITILWELKDGTFLRSEEFKNKNGRAKDKLVQEFSEEQIQDIVVTVEDASNGRKISTGIIKIGDVESLGITYEPAKPMVEDEITFNTGSFTGWHFKWDMGDGNTKQAADLTQVKHQYDTAGYYTVKVTAYEDSGMTKIKGFGSKVVEVKEKEEPITPTPTPEPTSTPAKITRTLTFDKDQYKPGERMKVTIESTGTTATTYESMNYYKWSAEPADEKTAAALKQATNKDYLYVDKSGYPGEVAPEVPGTYEVTGVFVQQPEVTISGTFVVKEGSEGYWKRIEYKSPENVSYDNTTTDSSDSRIKTRTVTTGTKYTLEVTQTTTYPDGREDKKVYSMHWEDLPERLVPGEQITLHYTSSLVSDSSKYTTEVGLGAYYDGWGNEAGIRSAVSSTGGTASDTPVTVVFEVPAYGSVGNATRKLELFSGVSNKTANGRMLIEAQNSPYVIYAGYEYVD